MNTKYSFLIFIAGLAPDIQSSIVELKSQLSSVLGEYQFNLKIIDVLENPELAEAEHILATPTMVRQSPEPIKKIVLNFNTDANPLPNLNLIIND